MNKDQYVDLLMSEEEYDQLAKYELPYVYTLTSGDYTLTFCGTDHSHTSDHPQNQIIENLFSEHKPQVLVIEGFAGWKDDQQKRNEISKLSRKESYERYGESGGVMQMSIEQSIPIVCPEPSPKEEYQRWMQSDVERDAIVGYLLIRNIPQYFDRQNEFGTPDEFFNPILQEIITNTGWTEYQGSASDIIELFLMRYLKFQINWNDLDVEYLNWLSAPVKQSQSPVWSVFNEAAKDNMKHREKTLVINILETLEQYKKVFIVYGASHAVWHEPVYRKWFEEKDS